METAWSEHLAKSSICQCQQEGLNKNDSKDSIAPKLILGLL